MRRLEWFPLPVQARAQARRLVVVRGLALWGTERIRTLHDRHKAPLGHVTF